MDSAELLDLLGNENRRRILRLLATKPCYVTEISEYIGVSPKAVIDHLQKLESAGLVESRVDDQRRKYYYISENLRLEVRLSPYGFGAKSAYPASTRLDLTTCRHLSIDVNHDNGPDLSDLAKELNALEQLERELSMAQRWVQGRLTDVMEKLGEHFDERDARLFGGILSELADDGSDAESLARELDAPLPVVAEALEKLAEQGVVERVDDQWRLRS
ncbi:metalloregulator ArsR/SmtB family transcription factor [Haloarculaceae archaeon H-GB2-1]|nr:metalloregulator ArsR/SmtB family transcription factor [Haloarculaceae archaeon H-GB1-1]MEA5385989.1 metalloregulator ArsR/SmtB family transcription factor [Haloarculaceae archaeon H-GB11]MEA5407495.1 metalloregulator ArsR/SmtB family transcription factor [Haloarculaceae archaeon H-GB2-1]